MLVYKCDACAKIPLVDTSNDTLGTATVTVTGGQTQGAILVATPPSGRVGVGGVGGGVLFDYTYQTAGRSYTINFGDGTTGQLAYEPVRCAYPQVGNISGFGLGGSCTQPEYEAFHQYTAPGSYTATVTDSSGNTLGSVIVTEQLSGTLSVSPQSGASPLSASFGATGLNRKSTYFINFGDGSSQQQLTLISPACAGLSSGNCSSAYTANASHIYASAGTYTATLVDTSNDTLGTATVTVSGSQSQLH
jgi:PKD repeat protein